MQSQYYYVTKPYFGGPGGGPSTVPYPRDPCEAFFETPPEAFFESTPEAFFEGGGEAKSLGFLRGYETLKSQG